MRRAYKSLDHRACKKMPRYSLTIRRSFGDLSLESDRLEELVSKARELFSAAKEIESSLHDAAQAHSEQSTVIDFTRSRRGRSEAVLAIDAIERALIPSGYLSTARTTSEVRQKIAEATGLKLQSRKVSQALGYLYKMKKIMRVGQRGNYRWFKR